MNDIVVTIIEDTILNISLKELSLAKVSFIFISLNDSMIRIKKF
jgi:hypothetical protein